MKSLGLYLCVVCLVVFAFLNRFRGTVHTNVDDYVSGGALVLAVVLAVPAQSAEAVTVLRQIVPWAKRMSGAFRKEDDS